MPVDPRLVHPGVEVAFENGDVCGVSAHNFEVLRPGRVHRLQYRGVFRADNEEVLIPA